MNDNTFTMRITHKDKHYHSTEMTMKDIFHKWLEITNPLTDLFEEQEVKE